MQLITKVGRVSFPLEPGPFYGGSGTWQDIQPMFAYLQDGSSFIFIIFFFFLPKEKTIIRIHLAKSENSENVSKRTIHTSMILLMISYVAFLLTAFIAFLLDVEISSLSFSFSFPSFLPPESHNETIRCPSGRFCFLLFRNAPKRWRCFAPLHLLGS